MTQASHYLFTLAECCQRDVARPPAIAEAMKSAVNLIASSSLGCIICGTQLGGAPSYLSLILPHDLGWVRHYGGVCLECGATHERPWLQRQVEARALFAFGEPMGHA